MTTARERYEKKTKVVTFRVSQEMAREIADMKTNTGLSNADLIKLGADIGREEIKTKLAQITSLAMNPNIGIMKIRLIITTESKSQSGVASNFFSLSLS